MGGCMSTELKKVPILKKRIGTFLVLWDQYLNYAETLSLLIVKTFLSPRNQPFQIM